MQGETTGPWRLLRDCLAESALTVGPTRLNPRGVRLRHLNESGPPVLRALTTQHSRFTGGIDHASAVYHDPRH
jgi:hypothetical protein